MYGSHIISSAKFGSAVYKIVKLPGIKDIVSNILYSSKL